MCDSKQINQHQQQLHNSELTKQLVDLEDKLRNEKRLVEKLEQKLS